MPEISVIIPTHNRAPLLKEHLNALTAQTYPRQATEWIVVADGCVDDSARIARAAGADRVIELEGKGAASARNAGLAAATAPLVAFLDDDIIPAPWWLWALASDAEANPGNVLHMGYCPYAPSAIRTHLDRRNAGWYEAKLRPLQDRAHAWQFTDFFGGNFAANRQALTELGGFDPRFALFEDAELALRVLQAGWRIKFVPAARAEHHAHREVAEYGRQAFRSGQVDVLFAAVHPEAASSLRIGMRRPPIKRQVGSLWRAITKHSTLGVRAVARGAQIGERFSPRPILDLLYALLWDGEYWRGVAAA
ncbi:MAG: glycosyltransferase family A protein [Candidatus Dormibacter sp.]